MYLTSFLASIEGSRSFLKSHWRESKLLSVWPKPFSMSLPVNLMGIFISRVSEPNFCDNTRVSRQAYSAFSLFGFSPLLSVALLIKRCAFAKANHSALSSLAIAGLGIGRHDSPACSTL
jgi:hypothetical protein